MTQTRSDHARTADPTGNRRRNAEERRIRRPPPLYRTAVRPGRANVFVPRFGLLHDEVTGVMQPVGLLGS